MQCSGSAIGKMKGMNLKNKLKSKLTSVISQVRAGKGKGLKGLK